MKYIRVISHGLVLTVVNLASVVGGFIVYRIVRVGGQLAIQIPVAVTLSLGLFTCWVAIVKRGPIKDLWADDVSQRIGILACSLLWNPILFIPSHYWTQGYVSSPSNVTALMAFQIPVNASALLLAARLNRPRPHATPTSGDLGPP